MTNKRFHRKEVQDNPNNTSKTYQDINVFEQIDLFNYDTISQIINFTYICQPYWKGFIDNIFMSS